MLKESSARYYRLLNQHYLLPSFRTTRLCDIFRLEANGTPNGSGHPGHSDPGTILNVYTCAISESRRPAMDKIAETLFADVRKLAATVEGEKVNQLMFNGLE
jgi:hypothetical protein